MAMAADKKESHRGSRAFKSNFIVPGLKDNQSVDLDRLKITLRGFLDELSMTSPSRVEHGGRSGAKTSALDGWEMEINGIPLIKIVKTAWKLHERKGIW